MFLARRVNKLPVLRCQFLSSSAKNCVNTTNSSNNTPASQSTEDVEHIEIPDRIHRGPTDILMALSSTVKPDPTAAHFKYHDDPYLIPMTNVTKRTFAMAQESGRKAARWIRDRHGDLFQHQEAQPPVEAFAPKIVFTEESEVDENCLKTLINNSEVTDAVLVYNIMQKKNLPVSDDLKQSLLELVCFYNNEEPLPDEFIEERWFNQQQSISANRQRKTWKDGDLAEQIFNEFENKTPQAYAAIIRGMAKYGQAERAYAFLQDATQKQLELDTKTFNSVISVANFLGETADQKWGICQDLLQQMDQCQLKPDLGTLNSLLETVNSFGNFKFARSNALKVLGTFKKLGVEPSLGTYYYVLIIFCRERGPVSHVLVDILNQIEGKEFTIRDPKDTFFFVTAMDVCRNHLHDKSLAKRVDDLLHTGRNYDLIGDSYKEAIYYRHLFALLCQTEPIEVFMQTYDNLVPNIYIPEPGIMEEIIKAVEMNGAIELMPRMWSDIVIFDHMNRESLLNRVLRIVTEKKPNPEQNPSHAELDKHFVRIALDIYKKVQEPTTTRATKRLAFTGQMIGDILLLLVRGGDFENATKVFETIDKDQHKIPGTPSEQSLKEFIECCVTNKAPSLAITCLQYCVENNIESMQLARVINKGFTLNEVHLTKLKSLVGEGFLSE